VRGQRLSGRAGQIKHFVLANVQNAVAVGVSHAIFFKIILGQVAVAVGEVGPALHTAAAMLGRARVLDAVHEGATDGHRVIQTSRTERRAGAIEIAECRILTWIGPTVPVPVWGGVVPLVVHGDVPAQAEGRPLEGLGHAGVLGPRAIGVAVVDRAEELGRSHRVTGFILQLDVEDQVGDTLDRVDAVGARRHRDYVPGNDGAVRKHRSCRARRERHVLLVFVLGIMIVAAEFQGVGDRVRCLPVDDRGRQQHRARQDYC